MRKRTKVAVSLIYVLLIPCLKASLRALGYMNTYRLTRVVSPQPLRPSVNSVRRAIKIAQAFETLWPVRKLNATCLHKSLFLWWLLRFANCDSEIATGIKRDPTSLELRLHAWVTCGGFPINEKPDSINQYFPLQHSPLNKQT